MVAEVVEACAQRKAQLLAAEQLLKVGLGLGLGG